MEKYIEMSANENVDFQSVFAEKKSDVAEPPVAIIEEKKETKENA